MRRSFLLGFTIIALALLGGGVDSGNARALQGHTHPVKVKIVCDSTSGVVTITVDPWVITLDQRGDEQVEWQLTDDSTPSTIDIKRKLGLPFRSLKARGRKERAGQPPDRARGSQMRRNATGYYAYGIEAQCTLDGTSRTILIDPGMRCCR